MRRIAIFASGRGSNAVNIIKYFSCGDRGAAVALVVCNNPKAEVTERCCSLGVHVEVLSRADINSPDVMCPLLERHEVDLIVLAGFMVKVPAELIKKYENRIINVHPALIPAFCGKGCYGLRVHEEALKRGVKITGATVHFVDEGMDTGPIIMQKTVKVHEDDTPETLQKRVMEEAEWVILPWCINLIAAGSVKVENGKVIVTE